jgi:LPS-assembly protein
MKNKFFIIIFFFLLYNNHSSAQILEFEAKKIEILSDEEKIIAEKGMAFSKDSNVKIYFDKATINKSQNVLNANGNIKIINNDDISINSDQVLYYKNRNEIIAFGDTEIIFAKRNIAIYSEKIFIDNKNKIIKSQTITKIVDHNNNLEYLVNKFSFELDNDLLKLEDLVFKDNNNNIIKTSVAFLNIRSKKFFGKDVAINLNKDKYAQNEPRIIAKSFKKSKNINDLNKAVFTSCKKRDNCTPWEISAKNIKHDEIKKTIFYDNATLKIYNLPVMYFPKFFHPAPDVERRSGFLMPTIKNSNNSGNYLNIPYFYAISDNKDITIKPRFYDNEKILFQNEYRQVNQNASHFADFSLFEDKNNDKNSHFFYEINKNLKYEKFNKSNLKLKIQTVSNDTYIKFNKIKSDIINDQNNLENSLNIDLYSNNTIININSAIYEDLGKSSNDRFEYILPNIALSTKLNNKTKLNGDFNFETQYLARNYDTNILEKSNINNLSFKSFQKVNKKGFLNNYEFLVKNINSEGKNSKNFKNHGSVFLSALYQYNTSYPLIKKDTNYLNSLTPKLSFKVSPDHSKKPLDQSRVDINNVYSLTRLSSDDIIEPGTSLTYGLSYNKFNIIKSREIFNFNLANNIRLDDSKNILGTNQMNQKTSNFFGEFKFNPNEFFKLNYNASIKNDISSVSYENLKTEFNYKKFYTTFDYSNENDIEENSYLYNKTNLLANNSNIFSFSTRKNISTNLTEFYNLMYQYKNDCLSASIEYNKDYYSDRDIKPEQSVFFKLTIIPFGETNNSIF